MMQVRKYIDQHYAYNIMTSPFYSRTLLFTPPPPPPIQVVNASAFSEIIKKYICCPRSECRLPTGQSSHFYLMIVFTAQVNIINLVRTCLRTRMTLLSSTEPRVLASNNQEQEELAPLFTSCHFVVRSAMLDARNTWSLTPRASAEESTYDAKSEAGSSACLLVKTFVPWLIFLTSQLQRGRVITVETRSEVDHETQKYR